MRRAACLVLLLGCDSGKKPPAPQPAPVQPAVIADAAPPIDAQVAADPCSANELAKHGEVQTLRPLNLDDCRFRDDAISEVMRNGSSVIRDDMHSLFAIEMKSASELGKLIACPRGSRVDWKHDHAWLVVYAAPDGRVSIRSLNDDGKTATLALTLNGRVGCGGMVPQTDHGYATLLLPIDHTVAFGACQPYIGPSCTGNEK